jgi:DNA polymerase-3 subunit alpha
MGHPLLPYREELKRLKLRTLLECQEMGAGAEVQVGLLVTSKKEHITKKGTKMAFCQVEDLTAGGEVVVFPETYARAKALLDGDQPVLLKGKIGRDEEDGGEDGGRTAKLVAESFRSLSDAAGEGLEPVGLRVRAGETPGPDWTGLKELLGRYRGQVPVRLTLRFDGCECDLLCGPRYQIAPSPEFWKEFEVWKHNAGCA